MADPATSTPESIAAKRKAFVRDFGPFVREMQAAIEGYLTMRQAGVSREDCVRGLESVLRDVWPFTPTHFPPTCETCEDTGYRMLTCWAEHRCGRKGCVVQHPAFEHPYTVPCECAAGDKHRKRILQVDEHLAAVGRARGRKAKPRGLTRIGT